MTGDLEPTTAPATDVPIQHPDDNPAWNKPRWDPHPDDRTVVDTEGVPLDATDLIGSHINKMMRRAVAYAAEHHGTPEGASMLDDSIWQMRVEGVPPREIAQRLGSSVTEAQVLTRLQRLYAQMDTMTATEARSLQVARLERLINMMYRWADSGSVDHAKLIIDAIERLNKIFALESDKAKIEIQILSDRQAATVLSVCGRMLEILLNDERVMAVLPHDEAEALMGRAMEEASDVIVDAQYDVIDTKELKK